MSNFETKRLPVERDAVAIDGPDIRILLGLQGGGMCHLEFPPGQTSTAITHKTTEEIWFFLSGQGQMWRLKDGYEEVVAVEAGVCLTIPVGTYFQFRSFGYVPLVGIFVTIPPWSGYDEDIVVEGKWKPTLP